MRMAIQFLVGAVMVLCWTQDNLGLAGAADGQQATAVKELPPQTSANSSSPPWSETGKRDPFVTLVVTGASRAVCHGGKQCLEIGEISLKGIIRAPNGMIAVVTNPLKRVYFLHEKDAVANGSVMAITANSVTFREKFKDTMGRAASRDVVRHLTVGTAVPAA